MAVEDEDAACAGADEVVAGLLHHRLQRGRGQHDPAGDEGEEIDAAERDGGQHQRVGALCRGGRGDAVGQRLGQQEIAHRRLRAMGLEAAHREDHGGARGQAGGDLGRGQLRDAVRHASMSSAIRLSACTPRPMQRSSGW